MRKNAFWGAIFSLGLFLTTSAQAATFVPNAFYDEADASIGNGVCLTATSVCTLRAAIQEANATPGADIITLAAGTYRLSVRGSSENLAATGDLDIITDITINGSTPGAPLNTIISGGGAGGLIDRVFHITSAVGTDIPINVVIRDLTIESGWEGSDPSGGGGICSQCQGIPNGTGGSFPGRGGGFPGLTAIPQVLLKNVIVRNNYSYASGAGIANASQLTIEDSLITGNRTPFIPNNIIGGQEGLLNGPFIGGGIGGGIANWDGLTTIRRTTISDNWAQTGGAIHNQPLGTGVALIVLEDSRITLNQGFLGGAIFNISADWNFPNRSLVRHGLVVNRTTIDGNIAEYGGGAIYNAGFGAALMLNSTITGNLAVDEMNGNPDYINLGGGIYNSGRVFDIFSSTISGNEAEENTYLFINGDEIFLDNRNAASDPDTTFPFRFLIKNSIVGDTTRSGGLDNNCFGTPGFETYVSSGGNNIDSGNTCAFNKPGDIINTTSLGVSAVLANNGGLTPTLALLAGSAAIGAGRSCLPGDQRGLQRDANCDIGAFEAGATVPGVPGENSVPIAAGDLASTTTGTTITINVLANDVDPDGNRISIASVPPTSANNGLISLNTFGILRYTPPASFVGQDTFTYTVTDGTIISSPATVTITVTAPGVVPPLVFDDESLIVLAGSTVTGVLRGNKPGTFAIRTQPTQGTVTLTNATSGTFSYTANANARGTDLFTFDLNDGITTSLFATVRIAIDRPLVVPTATPVAVTVEAGRIVTGSLANAANNGNNIVYAMVVIPTQGTVLLDGFTGEFSYTANPTATGTDSFRFRISDANASPVQAGAYSAESTVTITITAPTGVNVAPNAASVNGLTVAASKSVGGRLSGSDGDGDELLYAVTRGPTKGTVSSFNTVTGAFGYKANAGASGEDTFAFSVTDGLKESTPATVTINITPRDLTTPVAPLVATDDAIGALTASATVIPVLSNDAGSGVVRLVAVSASSAKGGVIINNGNGTVSYTSAAGFVGDDTFTYTMGDDTGGTMDATVTVTVSASAKSSAPPTAESSGGGGGGLLGIEVLLFGLLGLARRLYRTR